MMSRWFKKGTKKGAESDAATGKPTAPGEFKADVGLLLEGTYPYVGGGVSSWVHQIIRGMPELTFGVVFLGGTPEAYGPMKYTLPDNVKHIEAHYLSDSWQSGQPSPRRGKPELFAESAALHDALREGRGGRPGSDLLLPSELLGRVLRNFGAEGGIPREDFLYSEESWRRISEQYSKHCTDPSFVDYFWTVRTMHAPLFLLSSIARALPPFRVYHTVSTGYAGFLATMLHALSGRPVILSEHGIYTKERKIDLAQAAWIKDAREVFGAGLDDEVGYIRNLWIRFFEGLGRMTYDAAGTIVGLYEGVRERQIHDGAPRERTRIVPNGIDLPRFSALRAKRPNLRGERPPPIMGLLGRVVPIKDIRTFIRAMSTVCARVPDAEGWIIGPEEEDEAYARECHDLVRSLGLDRRVKFLGFQKPDDILPQLGLMVLTSISEALPLVILEGYAAGLPCVATDVGSCRELIEGIQPDDCAIGASGAVVPIASPELTAQEAITLLTDTDRWHRAQAAGITRVERYYTQPLMFGAYREIYTRSLGDSG